MRKEKSSIQINPHRKQFRSEESYRCRVAARAAYLPSQPFLSLARIIIRKDMRQARVPARTKSLAQFQTHPRIRLDVADIPRFPAMLRHNPELRTHATIAYRSTPCLARLAADCFEEGIPRPHKSYCEQQLNRRIE